MTNFYIPFPNFLRLYSLLKNIKKKKTFVKHSDIPMQATEKPVKKLRFLSLEQGLMMWSD